MKTVSVNEATQWFLMAMQDKYRLTRPQACAVLTSARLAHGIFNPYAGEPVYTTDEARALTWRAVAHSDGMSAAARAFCEAMHAEFKRSMSPRAALVTG